MDSQPVELAREFDRPSRLSWARNRRNDRHSRITAGKAGRRLL